MRSLVFHGLGRQIQHKMNGNQDATRPASAAWGYGRDITHPCPPGNTSAHWNISAHPYQCLQYHETDELLSD